MPAVKPSLSLSGWLAWSAVARLAVPLAQAGERPLDLAEQSQPGLAQLLARAEDVTDSGLAFTELAAARDTFLLGEPFALRLRFGIEREALRTRLVPLFQRPLDVPVQAFAPALEHLEGVRFLAPSTPETGASFVLGETVVRATPVADEERAGRTYAVFEYERRVAATQAGELVLDAPLLGFAHATRFRDDFVSGSVPLDRAEGMVRGRDLCLTILPLPEEGRPADFSGAMGRFAIQARAEPRELEPGQGLKLSVSIRGEGDLSRCEPPDLTGLAGFHLQGQLVERSAAELTILYDLAPRTAVSAVPPIRFTYFDTTPPAGYRTIESPAIPIVVRASGAAPPSAPGSEANDDDVPRSFLFWLVLLAAVAAVVAWRRARRVS
jgi:hypothetical protein